MPTPKLSKDELMDSALAVRRGEKRIGDLPEAHRSEVRSFMRKTPESKLRQAAMAEADERRTFRRGPQTRVARTRGY